MNIKVDGNPPVITNVTSSYDNGTYITSSIFSGDPLISNSIPIEIYFDQAIVFTGSAQLSMNTNTVITYERPTISNPSPIFTFNMDRRGVNTNDLGYSNSEALKVITGYFRDTNGNDAILTLPAPGEVNSLSYNKDIALDSGPPIVEIDKPIKMAPYIHQNRSPLLSANTYAF